MDEKDPERGDVVHTVLVGGDGVAWKDFPGRFDHERQQYTRCYDACVAHALQGEDLALLRRDAEAWRAAQNGSGRLTEEEIKKAYDDGYAYDGSIYMSECYRGGIRNVAREQYARTMAWARGQVEALHQKSVAELGAGAKTGDFPPSLPGRIAGLWDALQALGSK